MEIEKGWSLLRTLYAVIGYWDYEIFNLPSSTYSRTRCIPVPFLTLTE